MSRSEKLKFDSRWFEKNDPNGRRLRKERRYEHTAVAVIALGGLASLGVADVNHNQQLANDSSASIDFIAPALDKRDNDKAIIFFDGVDTPNANWIAADLGPMMQHVDDGEIFSANYGDASLSARDLATDIEILQGEGIHSVDLVGYSSGGDEAVEIRQIVSDEGTLDVPLTVMISSPSDLSDVHGNFDFVRDVVTTIDSTPLLSWLEYTSAFKFVAEMGLEWHNIHNVGDFFKTVSSIISRMGSHKTPGAWLMIDQMLAVQTSHVHQQIADAGKQENGVKETIAYLGGTDTNVVNYQQAGDKIQADAKKAGLDFIKYTVPHTVHGDVDASLGEYVKAFQAIKPVLLDDMRIQYNLSTLALRRYVAQHADVDPDYQH